MNTLKDLRRARRRAFNAAHSAAYKYGTGIRGFFNILKTPVSFFGFFLGIALTAVGIYKGVSPVSALATGLSIMYFAIMSKVISFSNALMSGLLIFFGGSLANSTIKVFSGEHTSAEVSFVVSTAFTYALLVLLFVTGLFLRRKIKNRPAPAPFTKEKNLCAVDVIAYEMLPIEGLTTLRKLVYALPDGAGYAYRRAFSWADRHGFVLASFVLKDDAKTAALYLFAPKDADISGLELASFEKSEKISDETFEDGAMKILAEEAYPSDGEMFRRYNIVMDAELKRRKTDKTVDHTVEYIVSFNEKKDMEDFVAAAMDDGFEPTERTEKQAGEPFEIAGRSYYAAAVCHRTRLGGERIEQNTERMISLAAHFNGRLRSWNVID